MHPVIRRPATQYLHSQTFTTRRGCGCNVMHSAPFQLTGALASLPIEWDRSVHGEAFQQRGGRG